MEEGMSFWIDLLAAIPSNPTLRERVALAKGRYETLEGEHKKLKEQFATLTAENASLKQRLAEAEATLRKKEDRAKRKAEKPNIEDGCYYFDGDKSRLYCTHCYDSRGEKSLMSPRDVFGRRCPACRNVVGF
jgi:hypothetical protein